MNNELYHHGILGMKWGVRRYQNTDGSLTHAGKKAKKEKVTDEFGRKVGKYERNLNTRLNTYIKNSNGNKKTAAERYLREEKRKLQAKDTIRTGASFVGAVAGLSLTMLTSSAIPAAIGYTGFFGSIGYSTIEGITKGNAISRAEDKHNLNDRKVRKIMNV